MTHILVDGFGQQRQRAVAQREGLADLQQSQMSLDLIVHEQQAFISATETRKAFFRIGIQRQRVSVAAKLNVYRR